MVGAATLAGFAAGLFVGARVGQAVVSAGSQSPYAPLFGLAGALIGGMLFGSVLEALGYGLRRRMSGPSLGLVDGLAGRGAERGRRAGARVARRRRSRCRRPRRAACATTSSARASCARSTTLLPPSGPILNALARFDPFPRIDGPPVDLPAPRAAIARDPDVRARGPRRGQDPGDGLRARRRGLGLDRPRRARRDQRARRRRPGRHDGPARRVGAQRCRRTPSSSTPTTTSPSCASTGLGGRALPIASDPRSGASGAILGFPQNGPYDVRAARLGATRPVITQDAYGAGRSSARSSPCAARCARATPAARWSTRAGAWWRPSSRPPAAARAAATAVPNAVVERDLGRAGGGTVSTGPCAALSYPAGVHGQDPRHRREAVRGPGPRARAARSVREAHRRGGQDRALAGGPRARHHVGRRPPRPARRARRVRRQVQEVAHGRPADRAARPSSSSCATSAPRSR